MHLRQNINKVKRGQQNNPKGRDRHAGNGGQMSGNMEKQTVEEPKSKWSKEPEKKTQRKGGSSREFLGTCFKFGEIGHRDYECPQGNKGKERNFLACEDPETGVTGESMIALEKGESLMFKRVLVEKSSEDIGPTQRKNLFQTIFKSGGKCCKVIVDSGSTENLVLEEMVENLGLKRVEHPCPYKVSLFQDDYVVEVRE